MMSTQKRKLKLPVNLTDLVRLEPTLTLRTLVSVAWALGGRVVNTGNFVGNTIVDTRLFDGVCIELDADTIAALLVAQRLTEE